MNKNINSLSPYTILTEVFRLLEEQKRQILHQISSINGLIK